MSVRPLIQDTANADSPVSAVRPRDLILYFLRLGATGFGGPIALVGYMQRDLVGDDKGFTQEEFSEGLALAQLAPGPLAAQLAIYLGWLKGGTQLATLVGFAFVLPSLLMVLGISAAYLRFGGLPWMQGAFYGVGAAVIAIIARSAYKLVRSTIRSDRWLWAIFLTLAISTSITGQEIVPLILAGGILYMVAKAPPKRTTPIASATLFPLPVLGFVASNISLPVLGKIFLFFASAGAFVFGSGLAIVPFLHGSVVSDFHWLTEKQFLDAVAVAMITPGPVVITVAFIGYLVAGPAGALLAALGVFLPCYLFVVIPARYFKQATKHPSVNAFVKGVTAAATGGIAGAVFVIGGKAIIDPVTAIIAIASLGALSLPTLPWLRVKVSEPALIGIAALIGLCIRSLGA